MCERKKIMSSVNAIGSNVSFGRAKAASKKAPEAEIKQPKPKFSELGDRTMAEKYGDVNINTNTARFILGDYILDHAIEFASTALVFLGALSTGKALTNKTSGQFVDALKNSTGTKVLEVGKQYIGQIGDNLSKMKISRPLKIGNALETLKDAGNVIAGKTKGVEVLEGSVVDKLANKVGQLANTPDNKAGMLSRAVKKMNLSADGVKDFFAKRGISRGADIVDGGVTLAGASVAAGLGNGFVDKLTDMNDADVAEKAENADQQHKLEQMKKIIEFAYGAI